MKTVIDVLLSMALLYFCETLFIITQTVTRYGIAWGQW